MTSPVVSGSPGRFGGRCGKVALLAALVAASCTSPDAFYRDSVIGSGEGGAGGAGPQPAGQGGGGGAGAGGSAPAGTGGGGGSNPTGTGGTGGVVATGTGGTGTTGAGGAGGTGTGGRGGTGGTGTGGAGTGGAGGTGTGTGGASGAVLFTDDFEMGSGKWIAADPYKADWTLATDGSQVWKQGAASNVWRAAVAGDISWTDQIVEARVKVLAFNGSSTSYLAGVCARFHDLANYYCAGLRSDGKVAIRARLADNGTTLGASSAAPVVAGTWYTVKLSAIGTTLTAYLDGVQMATATDATIASGGVALGNQNATAEYDDVRVTRP